MGVLKTPLPSGLCFVERAKATTIAAQAASPGSSFTEATPRPGFPITADAFSPLTVQVSHAQGDGLDLSVIKAGQPARDGVQLAYALEDQAATFDRGWNGPQIAMSFIPLKWAISGTDVYSFFSLVTIPSTQAVLAVWKSDSPLFSIKGASIAEDWTVTNPASFVLQGTDWNYPALVVLPGSERVLLFYGGDAFYTDDLGVTWTSYSVGISTETTTTYGITTVVEYRGDLLMVVEDTAANTIYHLASTDQGATFQLVDTITTFGTSIDLKATEDGIMMTWVDATADIVFRRLSSVFEIIDAVTATAVSGAITAETVTLSADDTGTLYVLGGDVSTAYRIWESLDAGATWTIFQSSSLAMGVGADSIDYLRSTWAFGQMFVIGQVEDAGVDVAERIGAFVLGGHSNVVSVADATGQQFAKNRPGFGVRANSTSSDGNVWAPYILLQNSGWTAAGTIAPADNAGGYNEIATTAQNGYVSVNYSGARSHQILVRMSCPVGGSITTQDVIIGGVMGDGTDEWAYELLIKTDTLVLNDINSAATDSSASSMTVARWLWVIAEAGATTGAAGRVRVFTLPNAKTTVWSLSGADIALTSDQTTPAASTTLTIGNVAVSTSTSRWYYVAHTVATAEIPTAGAAADGLDQLVGKSYNARPSAIPDFTDANGDVARVAVVAGPGRAGDTVSVPAYYEHGIDQAMAEVSPSPAVEWRSTSTAEQRIVFDLGESGWLGHSIALYIAGANFKIANLETWNGSSWDTLASLDLSTGFTGLDPKMSGDILQPAVATTADAARWLWEEEKRGGWVQATAGVTTGTRILSQSAGGWIATATGTTLIPTIRVADSSMLTSATKVSLVSDTGIAFFHPTTVAQSQNRYVSCRIPAGAAGDDTPDGESFYKAGIISVMRVQPFGADTSWGRGTTSTSNTDKNTDAWGTTRARNRGPATRRWSAGWPDPTDHLQLRLGPNGDYVGTSAGLPLAGAADVYNLLRGLQQSTDGGAVPVVAIEAIPATGVTLTDPTLFLYGTMSAEVRASQNTGEVGTSESLRVETITIDEIA